MNKKFFSLIEMMSVIAIIIVIAGISFTAFFKMTKGRNVEYSARLLTSRLEAARSYAITNNTFTALIFPNISSNGPGGHSYSNSTDGLSGLAPDYLYSSYRLCIVKTSVNQATEAITYTYDTWAQDNKWEFLPNGSVVAGIGSTTGINSFTRATSVKNVDYSTTIGVGTINNPSYSPGVIFSPSGAIAPDTVGVDADPLKITVSEKNYIDNGISGSQATDSVAISIDKYTGRVSYGDL